MVSVSVHFGECAILRAYVKPSILAVAQILVLATRLLRRPRGPRHHEIVSDSSLSFAMEL